VACPDPDNVFIWYYVVFGLTDCDYENGFYMGKLIFPKEYPWKPPEIRMLTETGRFEINYPICLSISNYHPESWNPVWPVRSIIIGLASFFVDDKNTAGAISRTSEERIKIAKASRHKLLQNDKFQELFADKMPYIGINDDPEEIKAKRKEE